MKDKQIARLKKNCVVLSIACVMFATLCFYTTYKWRDVIQNSMKSMDESQFVQSQCMSSLESAVNKIDELRDQKTALEQELQACRASRP